MPMPCSVCRSPNRAAVDAALTDGRSLRTIAASYGLHHDAVRRHKLASHLLAAPAGPAGAKAVSVPLPPVPVDDEVMATVGSGHFMHNWQLISITPDKIVSGATLRMFKENGVQLRRLSSAERQIWGQRGALATEPLAPRTERGPR